MCKRVAPMVDMGLLSGNCFRRKPARHRISLRSRGAPRCPRRVDAATPVRPTVNVASRGWFQTRPARLWKHPSCDSTPRGIACRDANQAIAPPGGRDDARSRGPTPLLRDTYSVILGPAPCDRGLGQPNWRVGTSSACGRHHQSCVTLPDADRPALQPVPTAGWPTADGWDR
jgi:hypothetical protein